MATPRVLPGWHRSSHSCFFPFVFIFMAHSAGVINLTYFCFHAVVYWKHSAEIISELVLKADARQQFFGCCCVSAVFIHVPPFPSLQEDDVWEGERDGSVHQGGRARAGREEIQRYDMLALPCPFCLATQSAPSFPLPSLCRT